MSAIQQQMIYYAAAEKFDATGGTKTPLGSWTYHFFTGPGTFTVDSGKGDVQYVCIGGGGGGGTRDGGGGGAGALYSGTFPDTSSPFPITVGNGGGGASVNPNNQPG